MRTILIASDFSAAARAALSRACLIAEEHCADLTLLHVVRRTMDKADRALLAEDLDQVAAAQAARHPCIHSITTRLGAGRPADVIGQEAARIGADLIVVGGHGAMRWGDELFGTTVESLLRHTQRPVLVARQAADHHHYRRVIAAIENDRLAAETLDLAALMASADTLFAVHAFLPSLPQLVSAHGDQRAIHDAEQRDLEQLVHRVLGARRDVICAVHPLARRGDPVTVIARAWEEFGADLVVAVTHGRTGLSLALRGSLADMLIEEAPFDLLLQHKR
jgi:universal stress protein E